MFKRKQREPENQIKKRILNLVRDGDYGIMSPPMDAQTALNELCKHLLGDDWYVTASMSQEQVNTEIVYQIERKYKRIYS